VRRAVRERARTNRSSATGAAAPSAYLCGAREGEDELLLCDPDTPSASVPSSPPLLALPRLRPAHHQFLDESRGIVHFLWIQKGVHAGEMPAFSR